MLNQLKQRKGLSQEDTDYREYLQKGFEGERKFDEILERLSKDSLIIQDLRLEANRQIFQIDTLVITELSSVKAHGFNRGMRAYIEISTCLVCLLFILKLSIHFSSLSVDGVI